MYDILAVKVGIRKNWAPHTCCSRCSPYLRWWLIGPHQCLSQSLWCGENSGIFLPTATFVSQK